ncbi:NupC/NupG family nucleoside CNT transporter [Pseudokineococcus basanitobsidens]|uniref:NupC/NupG family nucleoside CNT transporter n=1 Tax=Pseudokineococcus basanitobsidens TaxID=1926649 RepID=UPI003BB66A6E
MGELRGVLGLLLLLGVAVLVSRDRRGIRWRTVVVALALQVGFALLVLGWGPGAAALGWVSARFETLIGYAQEGTAFVFGPLLDVTEDGGSAAFALGVLPVIVFLGALIGLLLHLRVVQYLTYYLGGALGRLLRVSDVESVYGATVVFLGMSEAPLMIAPYLRRLRTAQVFTVMTGGLAAAAGSTLVGYAVLGAPLEYLLAATVMNAPAGLLMAKATWPDSTVETEAERRARLGLGPDEEVQQDPADEDAHTDVRRYRDTESANAIDAVGRGALAGGRIAVTVAALLVAFVALIALANGVLSAVGGWFGVDDLTFQGLLGTVLSPLAWLLGVPWSEAATAGSFIGQKTVLNEFVAFAAFGPQVDQLAPTTVAVVTFALAGFANFSSIAIQIGVLSSLHPPLRPVVARLGLRALLAGSLANLSNAAIAGVVVSAVT